MKTIADFVVRALLAVAVLFFVASCGSKKAPDTKEVAEDQNDAKFAKAAEKDAQFLVNVAEVNLKEIQLGQLAQKNGMIEDVRALGRSMETEHTNMMVDLKQLATTKVISIPETITDDGKDAYQKLMSKPGKDFDKSYCDMMVDGHKKTIDKFETMAADAADADIRAFATNSLPMLRKHLDQALVCQAKCKESK